jgi:hypothetical protein
VTIRGLPHLAAQAAILAMLALTLLSRTLIPAGYMIAPSAGGPVLTLCEAAAPASMHHEGHHPPAKPKPACAYAALASPALPPAPPPFAAPPSPPETVLPPQAAPDSVAPRPAALPPPSTGPPARV